MAKTYYTVDDLTTGDVLTETWVDEAKENLDNLIVPPACRAVRSSVQTIPDASDTAVQFNAADSFDTDAMHSTVSNNTRITFNTAGIYAVTAQVIFNATSDVGQSASIRVDGTTKIAEGDFGTGVKTTLSLIYEFSVNQYIELLVYADSAAGGNRDFTGSLAVAWLGRSSAP